MNIKNILVGVLVGLFVLVFGGLYLAWYNAQNDGLKWCEQHPAECLASYCNACETGSACERYCDSLNAE